MLTERVSSNDAEAERRAPRCRKVMHVLQAWVALANAFQGYRAAAFSGHDSNVKITRLSGMQTRRTALVPSLGRHLLEDVYYTVLSMSTSFLDIDDTNDLTVRVQWLPSNAILCTTYIHVWQQVMVPIRLDLVHKSPI